MAQNQRWTDRYTAFYDAYYHETLAAFVVGRLQKIDLLINLLVAVTALASAISGAVWWNQAQWKWVWISLAATAALGAIFHAIARVGLHLQRQGEFRRDFSLIRSNLQIVLFKMTSDGDSEELESEFVEIRNKLAKYISKLGPNIAATPYLREKARRDLDNSLKKLGITQQGMDEDGGN